MLPFGNSMLFYVRKEAVMVNAYSFFGHDSV